MPPSFYMLSARSTPRPHVTKIAWHLSMHAAP
jgi:hypothetical protein